MVQTIIDLTEDETTFLNVFKAKRGISSKNKALKQMIKEYQQHLDDLEFARRSEEILEKHLLKEDRKKYSKKELLDEIKKW